MDHQPLNYGTGKNDIWRKDILTFISHFHQQVEAHGGWKLDGEWVPRKHMDRATQPA